jgi:hypothetical protein
MLQGGRRRAVLPLLTGSDITAGYPAGRVQRYAVWTRDARSQPRFHIVAGVSPRSGRLDRTLRRVAGHRPCDIRPASLHIIERALLFCRYRVGWVDARGARHRLVIGGRPLNPGGLGHCRQLHLRRELPLACLDVARSQRHAWHDDGEKWEAQDEFYGPGAHFQPLRVSSQANNQRAIAFLLCKETLANPPVAP